MNENVCRGGVHRKTLKKRGYRRSVHIHSRVFGNIFPEKREKKEDFLCAKH
jgi:hypothetical protein